MKKIIVLFGMILGCTVLYSQNVDDIEDLRKIVQENTKQYEDFVINLTSFIGGNIPETAILNQSDGLYYLQTTYKKAQSATYVFMTNDSKIITRAMFVASYLDVFGAASACSYWIEEMKHCESGYFVGEQNYTGVLAINKCYVKAFRNENNAFMLAMSAQ